MQHSKPTQYCNISYKQNNTGDTTSNKNNISDTSGQNSIWTNANAGSGKTTNIINIILALLLKNTKANEILAITYTKNGTKEIQERLIKRIEELSTDDEETLKNKIENICGNYNDKLIEKAKTLHKEMLNENSNVTITTIDAFCYTILKNIANMSNKAMPVISINNPIEYKAEQFVQKHVLNFLEEWPTSINEANIMNDFLSLCPSKVILKITNEAINKITINANNLDWLTKENNNAENQTLQQIVNRTVSFVDSKYGIKHIINVLKEEKCSNTAKKISLSMQNWNDKRAANKETEAQVKELFALFDILFVAEKSKSEPSSHKKLRSKNIKTEDIEAHGKLCGVLLNFAADYSTVKIINVNKVVQAIIKVASCAHEQFFSKNNVISVNQTLRQIIYLIKEEKIHGETNQVTKNIKHLLVDEAQDVSPISWEMLLSLFKHLFQDKKATFSIVGDEKQSIFSFQGANIDHFAKIKDIIFSKLKQNNKSIEEKDLIYSYRTGQTILSQIDNIFNQKEIRESVSMKVDRQIKHISAVKDLYKEINLLIVNTEKSTTLKTSNTGWQIAHNKYCAKIENCQNKEEETIEQNDNQDKAIDKIIETITSWQSEGVNINDILILIRNREAKNNSVLKLMQKLYIKNIPCNMEKLPLSHHVVFQDFLTFFKFLESPHNNVNLSCLLRSIFFQTNIENLVKLCKSKNNKSNTSDFSLLNALNKYNPQIFAILTEIYNVFQEQGITKATILLIHKQSAKQNILKLYGGNGISVYNKIIQLTMSKWINNFNTIELITALSKMKINTELQNNVGIKISTIHASKGSESEYVILWDLVSGETKKHNDVLLLNEEKMIFIPKLKNANKTLLSAKEHTKLKTDQEELRLLYVAITRVKKQLCVIGCLDDKKLDDKKNWLNIIKQNKQLERESFQRSDLLSNEPC
ncbi:MAG: UvrD-helicase domain-containing protein [Alphaproteobacteria bacterium]|nr:UvrD-helicase domain-containing protein [Rickettsiales bacterium]